jgi:intein/homing endonuclease
MKISINQDQIKKMFEIIKNGFEHIPPPNDSGVMDICDSYQSIGHISICYRFSFPKTEKNYTHEATITINRLGLAEGDSIKLEKYHPMYVDYVNNFLTVSAFAEHYKINPATAERIIDCGRNS